MYTTVGVLLNTKKGARATTYVWCKRAGGPRLYRHVRRLVIVVFNHVDT